MKSRGLYYRLFRKVMVLLVTVFLMFELKTSWRIARDFAEMQVSFLLEE